MTAGERVSTVEHLAEMDRLLHDVQADLLPESEPAPPLAAVPNPPPPPLPLRGPALDSNRDIEALTELSARLLAATRELLAGYERLLAGIAPRAGSVPTPEARPDSRST